MPHTSVIGTSRGFPMTARRTDGSIPPGSSHMLRARVHVAETSLEPVILINSCTVRHRPLPSPHLLLVRNACRDVIELLATRRCHDDCASDVHTVIADAGIWLEGEHHARLQHGLTLARGIGADERHIEVCLLLIDLGA